MLKYWKYACAGSDYLMVDNREGGFAPTEKIAVALCGRRTGVGADGLILVANDSETDFAIRCFGADGREGNPADAGVRCAVLFAEHLGISGSGKMFRTDDRRYDAELAPADEPGSGVVSRSVIDVPQVIRGDGMYFLHTGTPQYVEFTDDVESVDLSALVSEISGSEELSVVGGADVSFAQITGDGRVKIRTHTLAAGGETASSDEGAAACAIAAHIHAQKHNQKFDVQTRGGALHVSFFTRDSDAFSEIRVSAPAQRMFYGMIDADFLS